MNIFESVWTWISTNIVPILSSTTFVSLLGFITYFLRTRRTTRDNTLVLSKLINELKTALSELGRLKEESRDQKDEISQLTIKVDGLLDILQTVYTQQLKDPAAIRAVSNIANGVRYSTGKTRKDIAANAAKTEKILEIAFAEAKAVAAETKRIVGEAPADKPAINI